ncbi:MAG: hypothetical protein M4D85_12570 [Actinomycetota bacterium]|nr:hypothetical protein [Actinomycetota bacterium]
MSLSRVRVRLLPWRPRWRTGRPDRWDLGLPDIGVGDDPLSAVVGLVLLVLLLPVVLVVVLGVIVLGVELSLLLLLLPLAWTGQVLGLLPWRLVLTATDGTRTWEEVRGTRALLRRRRQLRALAS